MPYYSFEISNAAEARWKKTGDKGKTKQQGKNCFFICTENHQAKLKISLLIIVLHLIIKMLYSTVCDKVNH